MPDNATIVACATGEFAPGAGARALVRASGPACSRLAATLLSRPPAAVSPLSARFRLTGSLEVPCLAWSGVGPRSYTGEDTLELLVVRGPGLTDRIVDRICAGAPGVRRAEPGEFSARAYLNGRITLEHAEGVAAIVAANSAAELAAAARILNGDAGRDYRAWTEEGAMLLALVEAGIDFTDQEDVVAIEPRVLRERVERLLAAIRARLGGASGREAAAGRPRVALAGLPNAGKSTLFNALLGRARSVATPLAGTTRDVLAEPLTIRTASGRQVDIELLDLPGLDAPAGPVDVLAQSAAADALGRADVQVRCSETGRFDRLPPPPARCRTVYVRTKSDRPGWVEGAEVAVCALTGAGLDRLRGLIADAAGGAAPGAEDVAVARHGAALRAAVESLARVEAGGPMELTAHHLRGALDSLGEITGDVPRDEVIGRIFASFCVGK